MAKIEALAESQIGERIARELPDWRYEEGVLRRTIWTYGWKGTLMVVNVVGHLAETAWHHPDLAVSYDAVVVKLSTHEAGGVSERDFALALKIDEVVFWRPGAGGGALSGTPAEAAYAYIRHD